MAKRKVKSTPVVEGYTITYTHNSGDGKAPLVIKEVVVSYEEARDRFNTVAIEAAKHIVALGCGAGGNAVKINVMMTRNYDKNSKVLNVNFTTTA